MKSIGFVWLMRTHLEIPLSTLGQIFSSPAPPPLDRAPMLERLVFESPVVLMLMLFMGALIALFAARSMERRRRGMLVAGLMVALAAGVWMLSTMVVTDREQIKGNTRDLIDAVAAVDAAELDRLMADNVAMRYKYRRDDLGKDAIISNVETQLGRKYPIKSHAVLETQASLGGPNVGVSQVQVHAVTESGHSLTSWWRLDWVKESSGRWRVTRISPLHDMIRAGR